MNIYATLLLYFVTVLASRNARNDSIISRAELIPVDPSNEIQSVHIVQGGTPLPRSRHNSTSNNLENDRDTSGDQNRDVGGEADSNTALNERNEYGLLAMLNDRYIYFLGVFWGLVVIVAAKGFAEAFMKFIDLYFNGECDTC